MARACHPSSPAPCHSLGMMCPCLRPPPPSLLEVPDHHLTDLDQVIHNQFCRDKITTISLMGTPKLQCTVEPLHESWDNVCRGWDIECSPSPAISSGPSLVPSSVLMFRGHSNNWVMFMSPRDQHSTHPGQGQNEWRGPHLYPGPQPPPPWPPPWSLVTKLSVTPPVCWVRHQRRAHDNVKLVLITGPRTPALTTRGLKLLSAAWYGQSTKRLRPLLSHGQWHTPLPWLPSPCPDTSPLVISLATSQWKCLDPNSGQLITKHCVPLLISCFPLYLGYETTTATSAGATLSSSNIHHLGRYTLDCDFCLDQHADLPIVHWPKINHQTSDISPHSLRLTTAGLGAGAFQPPGSIEAIAWSALAW